LQTVEPLGSVYIEDCFLARCDKFANRPFCFELIETKNPRVNRVYYFSTSSADLLSSWLKAITQYGPALPDKFDLKEFIVPADAHSGKLSEGVKKRFHFCS
jgi:hypothetical protein